MIYLKNNGIPTFSVHYSEDISSLSDLAFEIIEKASATNTDVIIFTDTLDKRISLLATELSHITNSNKPN